MAHFPVNEAAGGINSTTAALAGSGAAAPAATASGVPNSSPLNMFPQVKLVVLYVLVCPFMCLLLFYESQYLQETLSRAAAGGLGSLEFLRNNHQVQVWLHLDY